MPVLRSREIPPALASTSSLKTLKKGIFEPSTPNKSDVPSSKQSPPTTNSSPDILRLASNSSSTRRRSLRLASKSNSTETAVDSSVSRRTFRRGTVIDEGSPTAGGIQGKCAFDRDAVGIEIVNRFDDLVSSSMRNRVTVSDSIEAMVEDCAIPMPMEGIGSAGDREAEVLERMEFEANARDIVTKGKRKSGDMLDLTPGKKEHDRRENGYLSLRSGARIAKRIWEGRKDLNCDELGGSGGDSVHEKEVMAEDKKRKGVQIGESDEGGGSKMDNDSIVNALNAVKGRRKLTREEKGKGKLVRDEPSLKDDGLDDLELRLGIHIDLNVPVETDSDMDHGKSIENAAMNSVHLEVDQVIRDDKWSYPYIADHKSSIRDDFKDIARKNAARLAHFNAQEEEANHVNSDAEGDQPSEEAVLEIEDWPGPFSTAMKIIKDRAKKVYDPLQNLSVNQNGVASVSWSPRKEKVLEWQKPVPSLQDLCMAILAKNADAIKSLECVPDVIRHKLSQMLCDSRKMNGHFFDLLVQGSPSEIRLRDCSWLTEEQFLRSFEGCNTNSLTVLQLDQCGRCMPDYTLLATLVRKSLPVVTSISLKGACRLSDDGLSALISSAPALRSINLSQCSLLTAVGISAIAESLGSILRELYLDDCQTLDAMCILPALKKLKQLEVLSLAGIQSVSDKFMREFICSNGHNMKQLVLTNCVKLTDFSLKVIAETCSEICALDLVNMYKLTDVGIGHLANGCQAIRTLKLCRNTFSDEAIAAFLETHGESLRELSLNNVSKVGHHTVISLARCCRNLHSLDVSWCRNMTDDALGLIADSCLSLRVLKIFGCTQVTRKFLDGHSNPCLQVTGMKLTPILEHLKEPDFQQGPLLYSVVSPSSS
ncbi:hypothetical protein Nepgr_019946 [Nepenthes gracilis]|uniref:F-box/LRR-repeat protein 15-like leucin rich repeat domain-containing protein n=1 Tax=Nepenthes gracilis TaxID=150966 RepID=A0AAD3XVP5_NEPGR|nr:hypothetical protein Nepgr_019946 [Nepenthes gracilis]